MKGQRGIPKLYHVKYKSRDGAVKETTTFYADLWTSGHRRRVSLGGPSKTDATRKLREILSEPAIQGGARTLRRLSDLLALVTADYRREGYATARSLPTKIAHVRRIMGDPALDGIDTAAIRDYQGRRMAEGAARGTVELETCVIGRGFSLARELGALRYVPKVPHLRLENARQGFYLRADFEAIVGKLAPHWRPFAWACYHTGWRPKELLTRQWRHVDLERGWLRLEPTEAKNRHGRECPIVPELLALLRDHRAMCTALERTSGKIILWVFYNPHRPGHRLAAYQWAWNLARQAAGMPGRLLYDCRRTRVRNLERAGVPRTAGREWVGHRDPRIYERYAISDELMLVEARDKATAFEETLRGKPPTVEIFSGRAK